MYLINSVSKLLFFNLPDFFANFSYFLMLICPKTVIKTKNLVSCKTVKMCKNALWGSFSIWIRIRKKANNFSEKKYLKELFSFGT